MRLGWCSGGAEASRGVLILSTDLDFFECRSVEIFEKILGADHPETQDARDVLSTTTTPAATSVFGLETQEKISALEAGWAQENKGVEDTPQPQPESKDAPVKVDASLPSATATDVKADAPQAAQLEAPNN